MAADHNMSAYVTREDLADMLNILTYENCVNKENTKHPILVKHY